MAAVAKLEKPTEPAAPDPTKPIAMRWWKLAGGFVGTHTNDTMFVGGDVKTGHLSEGKVESITWHPGGAVIVRLVHASLGKTHDLVVYGGHGEVAK